MKLGFKGKMFSTLCAAALAGTCAFSGITAKADGGGYWVDDPDGWMYVYDAGFIAESWLEIDGYWYYFDNLGHMEYSAYRDGYWLNGDGTCNTSYYGGHWASDSTGWWYEDSTGWYPVSEWLCIDGYYYYFTDSGYIATSTWVDGCWLDENGQWVDDSKGSGNGGGKEEKVVRGWKQSAIDLISAYKYDEAKELEDMEFESEDEKQKYLEEEQKEEGTWALIYLNDDDVPELVHKYEFESFSGRYSTEIDIYSYEEDNGFGRDGYARAYYCADGTNYVWIAERKGIIAEGDITNKTRNEKYDSYWVLIREFHQDQKLFNIYSLNKNVYDDGKIEYVKSFDNFDEDVIALGYPKYGTDITISETEYNGIVNWLVNVNDVVKNIDEVLAQLNNM